MGSRIGSRGWSISIRTLPLPGLTRRPRTRALADWLRGFVREVVTVNPVTRDALSSIQIFLIEYALDCVDWEALAHDPRFRHLDWSQARLTGP